MFLHIARGDAELGTWVQSWRRDANQYMDLKAAPVHVEREARVRSAAEKEGVRRKAGSRLSPTQLHRLILEKTLISQERKDGGRGTGRNPREWTALPVREDRVQGRRVRCRAQEGTD